VPRVYRRSLKVLDGAVAQLRSQLSPVQPRTPLLATICVLGLFL
jgi:hypothetical protein